jgi:hypothetical protein
MYTHDGKFIFSPYFTINMGTILSTKAKGEGKVIVEVLLEYDEALQLKGNMNNIRLFSEDSMNKECEVAVRGRFSSTLYFLIPREMRKDLDFRKKALCHRVDTGNGGLLVFRIDKKREEYGKENGLKSEDRNTWV